jgi:hypothetical protein
MALKKQFQIGMKQRERRKKRRKRLSTKGQNLNDFFYGKYYIGPSASEAKNA